MKEVWRFVIVLVVLAFAASESTAMEAPLEIVRNTTDQVLTRIRDDRDALRHDPARMYSLVADLIFPHFDFPIMARWVLGPHWKDADEQAREAFVEQFRKLLVRTYATALLEFSNQAITYPQDNEASKGRTVVIRQEVEQVGGEPILLGYQLHNTGESWKVFDVAVDGVSLVKTYRASFSSIIKDSGLSGLIDSLSAKNKEIAQ